MSFAILFFTASHAFAEVSLQLYNPVPILRIFDEALAIAHYVDFLEFQVDWTHRFADDLPIYMQVSRDGCVLHLSEHHGDCCPGARIRVPVSDVDALQKSLIDKKYKYARPGIEDCPWGERAMQIGDPFGNRLTFFTPHSEKSE